VRESCDAGRIHAAAWGLGPLLSPDDIDEGRIPVKRIHATVAGLSALLLLLSACGGSDENGQGGEGSGADLVVAVPVPLTSGNSAAAQMMLNSAKLAVKDINAGGGAGGRNLVIKEYDDKLSPDESVKVAQRAVTVDKAEVIVGAYTTIEGLAIRQVTEPRKILFLNPSTISPAFLDKAVYTYRVGHDQRDYPVQMMQLLTKLGYKKPVVLADDGPTGATLFGPIEEAAKAAGLQPTGTVKYALNATDLSGPIAEIKRSGADSVIAIGSSAADAGLAMKTMVEQGVQTPVLGFSSLIAPDALKIGGDAFTKLPAIYTFSNMQPSKPQYQEFAKKYAAEYNNGTETALVEQAGATYDAFMILDKVLDQTGGDTGGDKLVQTLDSMAPVEGVAGRQGCQMSYKESHSAFKLCLVAFKFENGKPVEQAG